MLSLRFVTSLQNLDYDTFCSLIDPNCDVYYVFNGKSTKCTGTDFINVLKQGHFENTTQIELKHLSIDKLETGDYMICDITVYHRKGNGMDEFGPGVYQIESTGTLSFKNGKAVRIVYTFIKTQLQ